MVEHGGGVYGYGVEMQWCVGDVRWVVRFVLEWVEGGLWSVAHVNTFSFSKQNPERNHPMAQQHDTTHKIDLTIPMKRSVRNSTAQPTQGMQSVASSIMSVANCKADSIGWKQELTLHQINTKARRRKSIVLSQFASLMRAIISSIVSTSSPHD